MSLITYLFILFLLLLILSGVFVVKQQTAGIIERFGRFTSIRQSGLHYRIPLIDKPSRPAHFVRRTSGRRDMISSTRRCTRSPF